MIDVRVKRLVLGFVVLLALLALGAVAALFLWVNEKAVQNTVASFAETSLGVNVRFEGPVKLKRLSSLEVSLPAMTFTDKTTDEPVGRIAAARADVSLWSLALGAVHVNSIDIEGLEAALSVPGLSGNALFDHTFGAVKFPEDLRVSALALSKSRVTLDVAAQEEKQAEAQRFLLTDLTLTLGRFSPEMTTPFELSTRFEAIDGEGRAAALPELEMPVLEASGESAPETQDAKADSETPQSALEAAPDSAPASVAAPESASENAAESSPAEASSEASGAAAQALTPEAAAPDVQPPAENASESPSESPSESASGVSDAAQDVHEAVRERRALSRHEETIEPAAPPQEEAAQQEPEAPAATQAPDPSAATGTDAPAEPSESSPTEPAAPESAPQQEAQARSFFISEARAQQPLPASTETPQSAAGEAAGAVPSLLQSFDPSRIAGLVSATGTLELSTANRYVMLEHLNFSAEVFYDAVQTTAVATADLVRFKGEELSGMNAEVTLSRPQQASGDIHIGAVDFRLRPGVFESPEMRVAHSLVQEGRTSTLEATSTVRADLKAGKADFDSFSARVTVTGDKTLPEGFEASLSGFVHADLASREAEVGLSGSFAAAPVSYNGTIALLGVPRFRGELMVGELNTARLPALQNLDWMRMIDFAGGLRIGNIVSGPFAATQLHAQLSVGEGLAQFSDLIVNLAQGRVLGGLQVTDAGEWLFKGRIDGVNLDQLLMGLGATPLVSGVANGDIALTGSRLEAERFSASASLNVLRGAYHGIDLEAARRVVIRTGKEEDITRQGAKTTFDEAAAQVSIRGGRLTIADISARSVYLKSAGEAHVDLGTGAIEGKLRSTFAPMHGEPSIHLLATLSGPGLAPVWTFDWQQASQALSRAQGRPLLKSPARKGASQGETKEEAPRSIWQSVRDFFKF